MQFRPVLVVLACSHLVAAYLTHAGMRNLTVLTDELRGMIDRYDESREQRVLGGGEETEVTVAAAIKLLCADVLVELEKPTPKHGGDENKPDCNDVIDEYHSFLAATVKLLRDVGEAQMKWRWDTESIVFNAVGWLQSLWASRSANKQNRSFIEQQMVLYEYHRAEGCFGKDDEVLHRDVEVVEFLNDLLDKF